jgi:putative membrane protein
MTTTSAESPAARRLVAALSAAVVVAVAIVIYAFPGRAVPGEPGVLPTVNAVLNAGAGAFLLVGWRYIRRRQVAAHRRCMLSAFALSSVFLVTYLLHHAQVGSVPYRGQGFLRVVYFSLLLPHIVLAAAVVPLALLTIYRGWTNRIVLHRKIARWTLPIWLFVSVSGVALYWMLYR